MSSATKSHLPQAISRRGRRRWPWRRLAAFAALLAMVLRIGLGATGALADARADGGAETATIVLQICAANGLVAQMPENGATGLPGDATRIPHCPLCLTGGGASLIPHLASVSSGLGPLLHVSLALEEGLARNCAGCGFRSRAPPTKI